jgi:glycosyltransferase involved in cell wall biosynthesis
MKIIFYEPGHHKNLNAIKRMCKSCNIILDITDDYNILLKQDYDILILNRSYIDPYNFNENIKIIYGPQIWIYDDKNFAGNLESNLSNRCVYNSLSKWNENVIIEILNKIKIPIVQFPFSVDTELFKPIEHNIDKKYDCILYIKRRSRLLIDKTEELLILKSLKYTIFNYGTYSEIDYINALHNCNFMISLDAHESQGFALEEAMSCNVPLLVFDISSMHDETGDGGKTFTYSYLKDKKLLATSVPYWSDKCGIKITDINDMNLSIDKMLKDYNIFNPRKYILETLSDKVCMKRILDYFKL